MVMRNRDYELKSYKNNLNAMILFEYAADPNKKGPAKVIGGDGRGGEIRTHDPLYPKQVRYQTAPRPDT
jgi:hypothetical protein